MKLWYRIIESPTLKLLFYFFVMFKMPIWEEVLFWFYECKHFDSIINFLPGCLWIYSKFKFASIFKLYLHFINTLIGCVFSKFIYFAQGKENRVIIANKETNFVIGYDEFSLLIFSIRELAKNKFSIIQYSNLSLLDFIFF